MGIKIDLIYVCDWCGFEIKNFDAMRIYGECLFCSLMCEQSYHDRDKNEREGLDHGE